MFLFLYTIVMISNKKRRYKILVEKIILKLLKETLKMLIFFLKTHLRLNI